LRRRRGRRTKVLASWRHGNELIPQPEPAPPRLRFKLDVLAAKENLVSVPPHQRAKGLSVLLFELFLQPAEMVLQILAPPSESPAAEQLLAQFHRQPHEAHTAGRQMANEPAMGQSSNQTTESWRGGVSRRSVKRNQAARSLVSSQWSVVSSSSIVKQYLGAWQNPQGLILRPKTDYSIPSASSRSRMRPWAKQPLSEAGCSEQPAPSLNDEFHGNRNSGVESGR